ncbi:amino acid transporter [Anaeramoeba flamelloides]|uniref:Amino acid transporter n=1 Tax=Anaeramoeba flamelloides TaxID=1746091 RepID=A0AAV7YDP2_9EUKA|nr:amino acid transporter [Anaeramoeba flamelloides]
MTEKDPLIKRSLNVETDFEIENSSSDLSDVINKKISNKKPTKDAGLYSSIANLTNAVMGAGFLSLPYVFSGMGWALGIIMLVIIGILCWYTLQILALSIREAGVSTYEGVAEAAYGKKFGIFIKICIFGVALCASTSYLIIVGDTFPKVFQFAADQDESYFWTGRVFISLLIMCCIIFPVSMMKRMDSLRFTSSLSFVSIIYLLSLLISRYPTYNHSFKTHHIYAWKGDAITVLRGIPNIIFADTAHIVLLPVMGEFKNPTNKRITVLTSTTIFLCNTIYLLASLFGFFTFGVTTPGDILNGYKKTDVGAIIGRLAIGVSGMVTFPLFAHVTRNSINETFFKGQPFSWARHTYVLLIFATITQTLALTIPQIQLVTAFSGSTFVLIGVFIAPALCYLKLCIPNAHWKTKLRYWIIVGFGICAIGLCLTMTIYNKIINK